MRKNEYLEEYLENPHEGGFLINSREQEDIDLREAVVVTFNEAWGAWQAWYLDEDGEEGFTLIRHAESAEDALLVGASLVKEHGFIPNDLWDED